MDRAAPKSKAELGTCQESRGENLRQLKILPPTGLGPDRKAAERPRSY